MYLKITACEVEFVNNCMIVDKIVFDINHISIINPLQNFFKKTPHFSFFVGAQEFTISSSIAFEDKFDDIYNELVSLKTNNSDF